MDMDKQIYLATLLYKSIIQSEGSTLRHLSYKTLGPMMGTLSVDTFINTKDREYSSIEDTKTNMDDNTRYAYYNLITLYDAKNKYGSDNVEEVVKRYFDDYKKDYYYVINYDTTEPLIMRYDPEKFKKVYESDVAKQVV